MKIWLSKVIDLPEKVRNRLTSKVWGAVLGAPDARLHHTCHVKGAENITIGKRFSTGRYLWLEAITGFDGQMLAGQIVIGNNFNCSELVHIASASSVKIGNDVLVGSKVLITDHNHGVYRGDGPHSSPSHPPNSRPLVGAAVIIEDNVFIGDGVVVLSGTKIGAGAVVAANSIVSGTLDAATMYAGIPAQAIKRFNPFTQKWVSLRKSDVNL
jgi:acetyltransferase-like isoleucine patch superfamily enzyme